MDAFLPIKETFNRIGLVAVCVMVGLFVCTLSICVVWFMNIRGGGLVWSDKIGM